jgi:hypothetical protein
MSYRCVCLVVALAGCVDPGPSPTARPGTTTPPPPPTAATTLDTAGRSSVATTVASAGRAAAVNPGGSGGAGGSTTAGSGGGSTATAGAGGAGGSGGGSTAAGSGGAGSGGSGGGGSGGYAGSVELDEPTWDPHAPFCVLGAGDLRLQVVGCDYADKLGVTLSYRVGSGSYYCGADNAPPCTKGAACEVWSPTSGRSTGTCWPQPVDCGYRADGVYRCL